MEIFCCSNPQESQPLVPNPRIALLSQLAEAVRSLGGTALLALSATSHPVLYVRTSGRLVPVVVVHGVTGGWWFIWGRTGQAPTTHVAGAAAALCAEHTGAAPRRNLVAERRATLRGRRPRRVGRLRTPAPR
ncbi:hypothetical protein NI17_001815 [Thermobifida halotolerans]|uniref:Uncharacterized protein n=1 Tax=Thermobifida halotolerans TaxID=483545 RepID=A0AA97LXW4_9ACTN|nr:hypothetical protein [Thermobifida halotolerans]UOE20016.1 hypothetical protein NI17_001815 [Thermobifida halotolerans]